MAEKRTPSYKRGRGSGRSTEAQRRRGRAASEKAGRGTTEYNESQRMARLKDNQRVVKGTKSNVRKKVSAGVPKRRPQQRTGWPYVSKNKSAIDLGDK